MRTRTLLTAAAGLLAASPFIPLAVPSAAAQSVSANGAAQAPIIQITQDDPTAQLHPQGEGDWGYSMVTMSPAGSTALASVVWPGAAGGNAGTLAGLLGVPGNLSALNDPVRAQAPNGSSPEDTVTTPSGTTMTASVQPTGPSDQHASAASSLAGGGLGSGGTVGSSRSSSMLDFDSTSGKFIAEADSYASNLALDGVVKIGSVTSSATATSTNGSAPQMSGGTTFSDFTIAGQQAYLDSTGVHMGSPGHPVSSIEQQAVDAALHASGMQIYYTYPNTEPVGTTTFYYAGAVLFFWQPPGDTNHDTFTMSVGGAAVSMSASSYDSGLGVAPPSTGSTSSGPTSSPFSVGPPAGSHTVLSLPASSAPSGVSASPSSAPLASEAPNSAGSTPPTATPGASVPAGVRLPGGLGAGWWLLLALAAIAGAALTTRLPSLLDRSAAKLCANESRLRNSSRRPE
jgi:hypothetical protein